MASEIDALLWRRAPRPSRGPKPGLSLERIVATAVALADAEGLEALSMKRLATELDSGVMSLYRYVPGKDELVGLMYDLACGTPPEIPDGMPWREALTRCARAMREIFRVHPWSLPVSTQSHVIGPNEAAWVEAQLRAISGLRVPVERRLPLILIVSGFVRGAVAPEISARDGGGLQFAFMERSESRQRFPVLAETISTLPGLLLDGEDRFFGFGLERVLDGIAAEFDPEPDET